MKSDPVTVLMVAEKFPPHATSGTPRSYFFARYLPEFGYQPSVLAAPVIGDQLSDEAPLSHLPDDIQIRRPVPVGSYLLASILSRFRLREVRNELAVWLLFWFVDWLPAAFFTALRMSFKKRPAIIWVTAPHSRTLVVGYLLAVIFRRPLVVDLRDPWTYGSLWQPGSASVAKLEKAWARRIFARADRVVFTSPLTMKAMQSRYRDLAGKSITLTNGYSAEEQVEPQRGGFPGKCLFRYSGVLNTRRTPDILLQAFQRVFKDHPSVRQDVHLEFIGETADHAEKFEECGLSNCVSARGFVPRETSLALMRGADVNILLQTIETGTDVIAGKVYEYLAAQKPILAVVDPQGGDAWLLRQNSFQHIVSYKDEQRVAEAILALYRDWKAGGTPHVESTPEAYERRNITRELAAEFDSILLRNSRR